MHLRIWADWLVTSLKCAHNLRCRWGLLLLVSFCKLVARGYTRQLNWPGDIPGPLLYTAKFWKPLFNFDELTLAGVIAAITDDHWPTETLVTTIPTPCNKPPSYLLALRNRRIGRFKSPIIPFYHLFLIFHISICPCLHLKSSPDVPPNFALDRCKSS